MIERGASNIEGAVVAARKNNRDNIVEFLQSYVSRK